MKIDGTAYRSVWVDADDGWSVHILDQTRLPWSLEVLRLTTSDEASRAIRSMQTRGAPLIGAVAAYALWRYAPTPRPRRWSGTRT